MEGLWLQPGSQGLKMTGEWKQGGEAGHYDIPSPWPGPGHFSSREGDGCLSYVRVPTWNKLLNFPTTLLVQRP